MQRNGYARSLVIAVAACGLLLAACTSKGSSAPNATGPRVKGGTATVALAPGDQFNFILPLLSYEYATGANIEYSEYLMWRPLYWFGGPGKVGLNTQESLADPATLTASGGKTTATITLKPYRWSDGKPVTSRDVQFWFNLLKADKANWWGYVAGEFPDNVSSFKIISPSKFSLTFTGTYGSTWLYNELGQLIPIPQQAWDKESASGAVGNYDLTSAGAKKVYAFLAAQNKDLATYATNPLWQVVDGPWKLTSYVASTGDATYVRNTAFSGPATGSIRTLRVLSFTSDDAEFDSLLSAGGISYGYLPFNDSAEVSRVTSDGYSVAAWPTWGITYINLNFASPPVGAIFKQLYVRQAMQHLINQAGYISAFLHGYGNPTYGPVPLVPSSQFLSSTQKVNPYPYDPSAAIALLRAHGWKIVPSSADVCVRAGTAANDCGAGITSGEKLSLSFQYSTGVQAVTEEVAALQSEFSQAGIQLSLQGAPFSTVVADDVPCTKSSCWQLNYYGQGWYFDPGYNDPDGSVLFDSTGVDNGGLYDNPEANSLISKLPSGGDPALYSYQDYIAKQLPMLWMPQLDEQISAVNGKLKGVYPQDPLGNIYPENWYYVK
ncbi:MAG TPA: peptide ABC transporter substrate-binding protein [Streptosporangiaceae bacterium]|nr:peptide ABC transporter substrate-binding protein [Streptosporangiaceae bacterium]